MYQKSLEAQERQTYERKQVLKDALGSGKALPTEMRKDAKRLGKELEFDEAQTGALPTSEVNTFTQLTFNADPSTHIDNEYSRAGVSDPKIVITTSRDPSSKLLQFSKV